MAELISASMSIEDACRSVCGYDVADAMIARLGIHWAVVAAMVVARKDDNPKALKALRQFNEEHHE